MVCLDDFSTVLDYIAIKTDKLSVVLHIEK
jgi:hypothetical protein